MPLIPVPHPTLAVDALFESALSATPAATSFAELVARLKGRYPGEVLELLESRPTTADRLGRTVTEMIREARGPMAGGLPQGQGLALPHLLDAEWRFTEQAAEMLISAAAEITKSNDRILLKGVPSVVLAALHSSHDRQFWVLGEPNVITEGLKALTDRDHRFRHGAPASLEAAAAVLDPPWYVDQFRSMLSQASSYCRPGAHLLVSAPAVGVRPGISDDIELILRGATHSGLELLDEEEGALIYRTPVFELNALRSAGVTAWLPDWRRGNLLRFVKREVGTVLQAGTTAVAFELTLAGVRLRLLPSSPPACPGLTPICDGEVFPSVSGRAPRRSHANLWTSGNRAFTVDAAVALRAMIAIARDREVWPKRLVAGLSIPKDRGLIDPVAALIHNLTQLVDRESAEAVSLVGAAGWERSVNDARFLNGSWRAFGVGRVGTDD